MCRMVGIVFRDLVPLELLLDLRHIAQFGQVPDPGDEGPGHKDGWGIVSFAHGSPLYVGRSTRPAHVDPSFDSALEDVSRLRPPNMLIAHVRRSSRGKRSLPNTHPFVSDGLVFAHNGTVKKFEPNTRHAPKGDTDSEGLFMVLLDRLEEKHDLKSALRSVIREDVKGHECTGLVLLISDGRTLHGFRDFGEGQPDWYYDLKVVRARDYAALFQETHLILDGEGEQVGRGELVSIGLGLEVSRERFP